MSIELVTGHAGSAHVTSAQDGRLNAAAWGDGKYVLPLQAQFAITVDSANQVTVATGDALLEGRHVTSEAPTTLAVDSGTQGMKRNDIVCIVYSKNGSGVESAALQVVKGTESSGTPTDPTLPSGSILAGDSTCSMALWRLPINGITLGTPEQLFDVADELSANENATYSLGYTSSTRVITLTGAGGGASTSAALPAASSSTFGMVKTGSGISNSGGAISVPVVSSATDGLMTPIQRAKLNNLSDNVGSASGGFMGFGYQNSGGSVYLYFPVNAIGKTSASLNSVGTFTLSGNGTSANVSPSLSSVSAALRNGGALLELSFSASVTSVGTRETLTAWCSSMSVSFS